MTELMLSMWKEILGAFVGVLIGSIPIALGVLTWGVSVETRITKHDALLDAAAKADDAAAIRAAAIESNVTKRLDRIEDKLDRAIAQSHQISPGLLRLPRDSGR